MEPLPMNGGKGVYSYTQNSSYQRDGAFSALEIIQQGIADDPDISRYLSAELGKPFRIADMGCSIGPNTIEIVQAIVEAVKLKIEYTNGGTAAQFQAFFNDIPTNDFNTLFRSPKWGCRQYFAAAVPGSFHGRLFPDASLHFVHSAYALPWLSRLPEQVLDEKSPAWNKGKIASAGARPEVVAAFFSQFAADMGCFLQARAQEVVGGGLMVLVIPSFGLGTPRLPLLGLLLEMLEATLSDMVAMGQLNEGKVDSFNIPVYGPTPEELQMLVERNGSFRIVKIQPLPFLPEVGTTLFDAHALSRIVRAALERLMSKHFGEDITGDIFERLSKKIQESSQFVEESINVRYDSVLLLKRKHV